MENQKRNWQTIELPTFKVIWTPGPKFSNKELLAGAGHLVDMEAVTQDKAHQVAQKLNNETFDAAGCYKIINMEWETA